MRGTRIERRGVRGVRFQQHREHTMHNEGRTLVTAAPPSKADMFQRTPTSVCDTGVTVTLTGALGATTRGVA